MGDTPFTPYEVDLIGNIRSPQDCQKACQKTWGCGFFMTQVHEVGHCKLLNIWALKQIIEMEYNSPSYWAQFRFEDEVEMVTLIGPRECPDKKGNVELSINSFRLSLII